MKVGLEVSCLATKIPTGIARYAKNLVDGLNNINDISSLDLYYTFSRYRKKGLLYHPNGTKVKAFQNNLWPVIPSNLDIFHGLDNKLPNISGAKKSVLTVCDLFLHINQTDEMSPKEFRDKKKRELTEILKRTDAIAAITYHTKKDVCELLGVDDKKVFVTYLGVEDRFKKSPDEEVNLVKHKFHLDRPYLLFVGSISSRKNTRRLVEAFAKSGLQSDFDLVLAGNISYGGEETLNEITKQKIEKSVKVLDFIDDADLVPLYSGAEVLTFPTLYEGFGFPIIEAMRCETKVLTSLTGSACEITRDFGTLVQPDNIDSLVSGLKKSVFENDPNKIQDALNYSKKYTWENCAKDTQNIYNSLLS